MAVISSVLAILGLIILVIGVFAVIGAGSTASALGLGEGLTSVLTWFGSIIGSNLGLFAVLFAIGVIALVARGGGSGLGFERTAGAIQGATRGIRGEESSNSGRETISRNSSPANGNASSTRSGQDTSEVSDDSLSNRSNINNPRQKSIMANNTDISQILDKIMEDENDVKKFEDKISEQEDMLQSQLAMINSLEKLVSSANPNPFDTLEMREDMSSSHFYQALHDAGMQIKENHGEVRGPTDKIIYGTSDKVQGLAGNDSSADQGLLYLYNVLVALEFYIEKFEHIEQEVTKEVETENKERSEEVNLMDKLEQHHDQHLTLLKEHMK